MCASRRPLVTLCSGWISTFPFTPRPVSLSLSHTALPEAWACFTAAGAGQSAESIARRLQLHCAARRCLRPCCGAHQQPSSAHHLHCQYAPCTGPTFLAMLTLIYLGPVDNGADCCSRTPHLSP